MGKIHIKKYFTDYIEKQTDPSDLWTMSRKEIVEKAHNKFKKEGYSEKELEEILDELLYEEDNHLEEDEVSFNIIYPKNKKEVIKDYWAGKALLPYNKATILTVSLVILMGAVYMLRPNYLSFSFLFPAFLYIIYLTLDITYKNFEKRFKILKKDHIILVLIYIISIIAVLIGIIILNYLKVTSFEMNGIITYTFGGGLALGTVITRIYDKIIK